MATTTPTPERVVIDRVRDASALPEALEAIRDGLSDASSEMDAKALRPHYDAVEALPGWNDGTTPCEPVFIRDYSAAMDVAIDEIVPDVARMLTEAVNRRLPWTWEGEDR